MSQSLSKMYAHLIFSTKDRYPFLSDKSVRGELHAYMAFYWQSGYGAFSVSKSQVEQVRRYILGQERHHRKVTFQDEYREFLKRYGVKYDERYIWD